MSLSPTGRCRGRRYTCRGAGAPPGVLRSSFYQLEFERPVVEIERKIAEAERAAAGGGAEIPALGGIAAEAASGSDSNGRSSPAEVAALRTRRDEVLGELYANLSPWNTVRVARHPNRPQTRDYIDRLCRDFCELHGDRRFGDDPAIVTG
ncbi:MAG: hypothetical protein ACF8LK_05755, partial [Phycisphaerales bacterium JB041]